MEDALKSYGKSYVVGAAYDVAKKHVADQVAKKVKGLASPLLLEFGKNLKNPTLKQLARRKSVLIKLHDSLLVSLNLTKSPKKQADLRERIKLLEATIHKLKQDIEFYSRQKMIDKLKLGALVADYALPGASVACLAVAAVGTALNAAVAYRDEPVKLAARTASFVGNILHQKAKESVSGALSFAARLIS